MNQYKATYEVADGYVGKSRPQHFTIRECELEDDMGEDELRELYETEMREHFEENITPEYEPDDMKRFIDWATEIISERFE